MNSGFQSPFYSVGVSHQVLFRCIIGTIMVTGFHLRRHYVPTNDAACATTIVVVTTVCCTWYRKKPWIGNSLLQSQRAQSLFPRCCRSPISCRSSKTLCPMRLVSTCTRFSEGPSCPNASCAYAKPTAFVNLCERSQFSKKKQIICYL